MSTWIEDADDMDHAGGRISRKHVTCSRLWEYRQSAGPIRRLTRRQRLAEISELMEIMHCDDLNTREAEYVRGRLNVLRGRGRNGKPKAAHMPRDPVMVQIGRMKRMIERDREEHGQRE